MCERPTRLEVLAALQTAGVEPGADLAAIAAAARRLGFRLGFTAHDGSDPQGRRSVLHRAAVARDGRPVATAYSSESARDAAVGALGFALIYERRRAERGPPGANP